MGICILGIQWVYPMERQLFDALAQEFPMLGAREVLCMWDALKQGSLELNFGPYIPLLIFSGTI